MAAKNSKQIKRQKIRFRIRKKISGTSQRPRLVPTVTNKRIYVQLIDDTKGVTLLGISVKGKNIQAGEAAGTLIATKALEKKIDNVVFDRAGKPYHGVIRSLSKKANEAGLKH